MYALAFVGRAYAVDGTTVTVTLPDVAFLRCTRCGGCGDGWSEAVSSDAG